MTQASGVPGIEAKPAQPPATPSVSPPGTAVIVFDGVCVLCNGWVRFLLPRDRAGRYRFAPMQGDTGRALLIAQGQNPDDPQTFLLVEYAVDGATRVSTDSTAVLRVLAGLGGPWRLASFGRLIPGPLRDAGYRLIARNRYRWFGRREACVVPSGDEAVRFL